MNSQLTISLKNEISEISSVVEKVEGFCEENLIHPKILNTINLALDEIITNIISYGYTDGKEHIIDLTLLADDKNLTVKIEDDALAFNPLEQAEPDINKPLEDKQIGGLGIHLIRKLLDELEYNRIDGKNVFFMKKKLILT